MKFAQNNHPTRLFGTWNRHHTQLRCVWHYNLIWLFFLQGFAEDLSLFPDESFDAVIETLVLCSVNSVEKSLQEIQRVLKPGGVFCFLDHVKGPEATWLVTIQNFLTSTVSQCWNSIFSSNQLEQLSAALILELKKCALHTN